MFSLSAYQFKISLQQSQFVRVSMIVLTLLILPLLTACIDKEQEQAAVREAPKVRVTQPVIKTIKKYSIYTGTTRAFKSADVVARVAGRLESIDFIASSEVKKGDLLFRIEKEKYQAQHDNDQALLESAKAELALAKTEVMRMEQASHNRAVSELEVDKAKAHKDVAIASVKSAQAALADSGLNLSYTNVVSPISGVVSREMVDAGNLVGQDGTTLLTRVNAMQPMYVYFNVSESSILKFLDRPSKTDDVAEDIDKRKISAFVERGNESDFPHEGLIDYIDNEVDGNTGTVEVRLRLANEDLKFFPGLFVRIKVPGADIEDAVLVKEAAIGSDLGGKYVLIVGDNDVVELRYVTLGLPQAEGYVHIISGIETGETYIVNGILRARPGLPVQPQKEEG
ncbi:MAG: efflux transporter periplasmic adaptor subunit [Gammaproteobacteria bacterium]|nr:MAG: efflux transporter periplasmic adaptor subunit [Gammaproteobacteria bacterium]RKZ94751.1 MAG: efflux transporter periplasmic adaptor subunit [Gammaproteobacteria bacterium]RKZ97248.1 MAG: efflux transporter periplasmic adaptor subunit [Gammaproteobacteria bacterium]